MIEIFSEFLKTMKLGHTKYHYFNLFSINCQRRTIIWQLFLYRAAKKKKKQHQFQDYSCEIWQVIPLRMLIAESICATKQVDPPFWPKAWNDLFHFPPELSQLAAGYTVAMPRG